MSGFQDSQPSGTSRTILSSSVHPSLFPVTTAVSSSSALSCPTTSVLTASNLGPIVASHTGIARITTEVEQNQEIPEMLSSLHHTSLSSLPRTLNNQHQQSSTRATKQKTRNSDFTPETAKIESLKIELSYARTKIVDLESKVKDGQESLKIYSHKLKILEETRAAFLNKKYSTNVSLSSNVASSDASSSNTSVLSSDCSCQIRAKLTRNSEKLEEFELRFTELCHVVDGIARIGENSDTASYQPTAPPSAPPPPDPSQTQQSQSDPDILSIVTNQESVSQPCNDIINEALDVSSEAESSDFAFSDPEDIDLRKLPLN